MHLNIFEFASQISKQGRDGRYVNYRYTFCVFKNYMLIKKSYFDKYDIRQLANIFKFFIDSLQIDQNVLKSFKVILINNFCVLKVRFISLNRYCKFRGKKICPKYRWIYKRLTQTLLRKALFTFEFTALDLETP